MTAALSGSDSLGMSLAFSQSGGPLASAQSGLAQLLVLQSEFAAHGRFKSHFAQVSPPQSTSLSSPFFWPSSQALATHTRRVTWQPPLEQSAPVAQARPVAQPSQSPPPQSTSVSAPLLTPSRHAEGTHLWPALQVALAQSGSIAHALPSVHAGQAPPPQSTSVSVPSFDAFSHPVGPSASSVASTAGATVDSAASAASLVSTLPMSASSAASMASATAAASASSASSSACRSVASSEAPASGSDRSGFGSGPGQPSPKHASVVVEVVPPVFVWE